MGSVKTSSSTIKIGEYMKASVLAFAGSIASGKSTISLGVANALGWPYVSFGDYIRKIAKLRGLEDSREIFQEIGQSLIEEGWDKFCWSVLNQVEWSPGKPLVIDGIRHIEAIDTLRSIAFPAKLLLIFIEVKESTREARFLKRETYDHKNLHIVENHPVEAQVKTLLPQTADLIVRNDEPIADTLYQIIMWISKNLVVGHTGNTIHPPSGVTYYPKILTTSPLVGD